MKISTEEKKIEAVKRMNLLGIYPETIRQFDEEGYVSLSEPPFGAYFWVQGEELERIREFEEKYTALVYTVVRGRYLEIGTLDAYLYVSDEREEWEYDAENFGHGEAFAYVYNHDYPCMSEFGYIGVKLGIAAGLIRTW